VDKRENARGGKRREMKERGREGRILGEQGTFVGGNLAKEHKFLVRIKEFKFMLG
jgi:hypothetical protein